MEESIIFSHIEGVGPECCTLPPCNLEEQNGSPMRVRISICFAPAVYCQQLQQCSMTRQSLLSELSSENHLQTNTQELNYCLSFGSDGYNSTIFIT